MKTHNNILIAFILNLFFSVFELVGGIFTGSIAIISDAIHDIGDAISIGISYILEKKSKKQPDDIYTYGYSRYSVIGGIITIMILLFGSLTVIINAIKRVITPTEINYDGMIIFAVVGVLVNLAAAHFTHNGDSLNQKAVNLHMLEDVLGWIVVLIGAIIMRFTDFWFLDPVLSICVAVFIIFNGIKNLKKSIEVLCEKMPSEYTIEQILEHLMKIKGIIDIHHIHIWSIDGNTNYATMHIVTEITPSEIKPIIRKELEEFNIFHSTLEFETKNEECNEKICKIKTPHTHCHHHHH